MILSGSPRLSFYLIGPILCLSLGCLFSCQVKTKNSHNGLPVATTETSSSRAKVTQIDEAGLRAVIKPTGKPLLINFWATWCGPCREEFPDLVEIATDYKDKIDVITITLDDPSEIEGEVAKFLAEMRSESPTYLLKARDENAAIELVSKNWQGALPFTILFTAQGETIYSKQGKFETDVLRAHIEKL